MQRINIIQTVHEAQRTHLGLLQCRDVLGVMGDCGELLKFWPPHPTACFSWASPCQDPPCLYGPLQDGSYKSYAQIRIERAILGFRARLCKGTLT